MKLRLDGWERLSTFGNSADIYARDNRRILVDKDSREVICRYMLRKSSDDEERNNKKRGKQVKA